MGGGAPIMAKTIRESVRDVATAICGGLSDMQAIYDLELDNRGGSRSAYIHLRQLVPAKIRVSDHPSRRIDKDKGRAKILVIDVGVGPRKTGIT